MTTYERIQALCRSAGFEISNLSEHLPGVTITRGSISKWKNGAVPRASTLKSIAEHFGVSVEYLLGTVAAPFSVPGVFPIQMKKVPLLGEIACGQPIFADAQFGNFVATSEDVEADFCLRAKGDSMIGARIHDGDVVFIREQPSVENGEIAAVIVGDEATLKRVYFYPGEGKLVLSPENPAFAPLVFVGPELSGVRILGKAVAFQSRVK